jgi:hypothetical protein
LGTYAKEGILAEFKPFSTVSQGSRHLDKSELFP